MYIYDFHIFIGVGQVSNDVGRLSKTMLVVNKSCHLSSHELRSKAISLSSHRTTSLSQNYYILGYNSYNSYNSWILRYNSLWIHTWIQFVLGYKLGYNSYKFVSKFLKIIIEKENSFLDTNLDTILQLGYNSATWIKYNLI